MRIWGHLFPELEYCPLVPGGEPVQGALGQWEAKLQGAPAHHFQPDANTNWGISVQKATICCNVFLSKSINTATGFHTKLETP